MTHSSAVKKLLKGGYCIEQHKEYLRCTHESFPAIPQHVELIVLLKPCLIDFLGREIYSHLKSFKPAATISSGLAEVPDPAVEILLYKDSEDEQQVINELQRITRLYTHFDIDCTDIEVVRKHQAGSSGVQTKALQGNFTIGFMALEDKSKVDEGQQAVSQTSDKPSNARKSKDNGWSNISSIDKKNDNLRANNNGYDVSDLPLPSPPSQLPSMLNVPEKDICKDKVKQRGRGVALPSTNPAKSSKPSDKYAHKKSRYLSGVTTKTPKTPQPERESKHKNGPGNANKRNDNNSP